MQKTNIIGASLALVDRFAHLDQSEALKIEEDAAKWYQSTKDKLYDNTTGQQKEKPSGIKQWFIWLSEQWYVRIIIGLLFTLVLIPWAKRRTASDEDVRDKQDRKRSRYDRDGYDRDGFDRNGVDRDGYDEEGYFVGDDYDDDDDSDDEDDDYDDDDD